MKRNLKIIKKLKCEDSQTWLTKCDFALKRHWQFWAIE